MFTLQRRGLALALAGFVAATATVVLASTGASAINTVDPSITGDPNAANGTISFYDASGNQISSGPLASPFTGYAVASSATTRTGTVKATLFVATPDHTKSNSLQWFNQNLTAASTFPLVGAPAGVPTTPGVPAVAVGAGDGDLGGAFAGAVNDPTPGFDHIVQVRMEDSGAGKPVGAPFWQADLFIDTAAGTWTQVYPTPPPTKTSTSLTTPTATPASPAAHGSTVTLTSTLSAADTTHPAGAVELFDGATDKGAATLNAGTGEVSATDTPADGPHSYTFKFTPSDTTTYSQATSSALSFIVNAPVASTTVLSASPASPSTVGDAVTLTAAVTPSSATGTVQFLDGTVALGTPVAVSGGTASTTTSVLTAATHTLTAKFSSTSGAVLGSTSNTVSYKVNPAPASTTTTTLAVTPTGPVAYGTPVSLSATVSPVGAAGTVQFLDGSSALGAPVAVSAGTATKSVTSLTSGTHSLKAQFLPTDPASFGTSTSAPVSLNVDPQSSSTTLAVSPAGPVDHGQAVSLKATVAPTGAAGTVTFFDGSTAIGSPVVVSAGIAQASTSTLSVATHVLTATFTPTSATQFTASTSSPVSLVVQNPPPGATTTTLAVTPAGPIVTGGSASLTATVGPVSAAGAVQFFDGAAAVGAPVTVAAGKASRSVTPALGSHSYTATFTPTDTVSFKPSTSGSATLVVVPPATPTTTVLSVNPAGPVDFGTSVTLSATVSATKPGDPAPSGGSVQFKDGAKVLGNAPLSGGAASLSTSMLGGGTHSLTAGYLPADSAVFEPSTSAATSLTVRAQPTTTTLTATPAAKVSQGHAVHLTATVAPVTAAGSVSFSDGSKVLATVPVKGGSATLVTSALAVGGHSLTATFTPTSPAAFGPSTSGAATLTVEKAPAVTGVTRRGAPVGSGGTLLGGDVVTITGSGYQPGELVKVILQPGGTVLASVLASSTGTVSATVNLPATLSAGKHSLILRGSLADSSFAFTVAVAGASGSPTSSPGSAPSTAGSPSAGSTSGGGALASTGSSVLTGLCLALSLLAMGAGLVLSVGRRTR